MHLPWFKRTGILFIPTSVIGWIISIAVLAFTVYTFRDIDSRSHSVSDTLINFAFNFIFIFAVYALIAYFTSAEGKKITKE